MKWRQRKRENDSQREYTECIYVLRNVDTVKRVFRVHFNTLSPWALGKFQFGTMAIEPKQNLQFNSCLIFNEVCIYFPFSVCSALILHFSTCRKLQAFKDMYSKKNQFQILVEWSYLSLNYTKKRGFVQIEMMNFPAQYILCNSYAMRNDCKSINITQHLKDTNWKLVPIRQWNLSNKLHENPEAASENTFAITMTQLQSILSTAMFIVTSLFSCIIVNNFSCLPLLWLWLWNSMHFVVQSQLQFQRHSLKYIEFTKWHTFPGFNGCKPS